jgi:hypothetical protein
MQRFLLKNERIFLGMVLELLVHKVAVGERIIIDHRDLGINMSLHKLVPPDILYHL